MDGARNVPCRPFAVPSRLRGGGGSRSPAGNAQHQAPSFLAVELRRWPAASPALCGRQRVHRPCLTASPCTCTGPCLQAGGPAGDARRGHGLLQGHPGGEPQHMPQSPGLHTCSLGRRTRPPACLAALTPPAGSLHPCPPCICFVAPPLHPTPGAPAGRPRRRSGRVSWSIWWGPSGWRIGWRPSCSGWSESWTMRVGPAPPCRRSACPQPLGVGWAVCRLRAGPLWMAGLWPPG